MSTRIDVSVGGNAQQRLLELNRQQSDANRLSYQQRQLQAKAEARIRAVRQARSSGTNQGVVTAPFTPPALQKEPAAQQQQGLELGHFWVGSRGNTAVTSRGWRTIATLGYDSNGNPVPIYQSGVQTELMSLQGGGTTIGVGSGKVWTTIGHGTFSHPPLRSAAESDWNVYQIEYYTDEYGVAREDYVLATRSVRHQMYREDIYGFFVLPTGKGAFLLVWCDKYVYGGVDATVRHLARFSDPILGQYPHRFSCTPGIGFPTNSGDSIDCPATGYTAASSYLSAGFNNRVYLCTNSSMRQLTSLPAKFQGILDVLNPPPATYTATIDINSQSYSYEAATLGVSHVTPSGLVSGSETLPRDAGFQGIQGVSGVWTPQVFESLNSISQFIDSKSIKQFPYRLRWGLADQSDGGYARFRPDSEMQWGFRAAYEEGLPLHHALWRTPNQVPDPAVWDSEAQFPPLPRPQRIRKATLQLDDDRIPLEPGVSIGRLHTVWDWDDPAYCRQMCLALGFKPEDLVP